MVAQQRCGVGPHLTVEGRQLACEELAQVRRQLAPQPTPMLTYRGPPAGARLCRRAVLEFEQMLDDDARIAEHGVQLGPRQRLHLLDQIVQIQLLEALRPQQLGLALEPDKEVGVVALACSGLDSGGHAQAISEW